MLAMKETYWSLILWAPVPELSLIEDIVHLVFCRCLVLAMKVTTCFCLFSLNLNVNGSLIVICAYGLLSFQSHLHELSVGDVPNYFN